MKLRGLIFFLLLFKTVTLQAQSEMEDARTQFSARVKILHDSVLKRQYTLKRGDTIPMLRREDRMVYLDMQMGNTYHILVVGDPELTRLHVTLFHNGLGILAEDHVQPWRDHVYWTEFTYPCQQTGRYVIDLVEQSPFRESFLYLGIYQHDGMTKQ